MLYSKTKSGIAEDAHDEVPNVQIIERVVEVPRVQYQEVDRHVEVPQVQYADETIDVPVGVQRRVPTIQTAQGTVEVPQVQFLDRMVDVPIEETKIPKIVSQDRIPQRAVEQVVDTLIPQIVEGIIEVFKTFIRDRVQQRMVEQTIETPAASLDEEILETTKTQTEEKIICRLKEDQSESSEDAKHSHRYRKKWTFLFHT